MFINPIQVGSLDKIGSLERTGLAAPKKTDQASESGFKSVFEDAWNAASETQRDLEQKQYLQSIGEIDDTYTVPVAAAKAEISLNLLVGLRNKALDAYNELMRINV